MNKEQKLKVSLVFDGILYRPDKDVINSKTIKGYEIVGSLDFILKYLTTVDFYIISHRSSQLFGRSKMQNWLRDRLINFSNIIITNTENSSNIPHFDDFITFYGGYQDPIDIQIDDWANEVINRLYWPLFRPNCDINIDDKAFLFTGRFPNYQLDKNQSLLTIEECLNKCGDSF